MMSDQLLFQTTYISVCYVLLATSIFQITNSLLDINECDLDIHSCNPETSLCVNILGGFKCFCKKGFKLAEDGVTCKGMYAKQLH